jgi:V8-like Glu-specific endopeptidase
MNVLSDINFTTTKIRTLRGDNIIGNASGFFFRTTSCKYLITNRHVVVDEDSGYFPEEIMLTLHANRKNLKVHNSVRLNLYDSGDPIWLQHRKYDEHACDVVAIPLTSSTLSQDALIAFNSSSLTFFNATNLDIPQTNPFGNVVVVGYPLGFYDEINNLPVYRKAMIATAYPFNFMDRPYFLIDANLHEGTSGSPVVNSHHTLFREGDKKEGYVLFGVHSAEHVVDEEPLGLNVVWHSSLIMEIINDT